MTKFALMRQSFYVVLFFSALVAIMKILGIAALEGNMLVIRINVESWVNPAYVTAFASLAGPAVASIAVALGLKTRTS